jgi:histidinol-phosphate aminotransferase
VSLPPQRDDLHLREGYHSPQLAVEVRLNTNESPYPPPAAWLEALREELRTIAFHRYPDRAAWELRKALADLHTVRPEQIFCANGSNEVLQSLCLAYGGPGRRVATFEPTYALHAHIAHLTGTGVTEAARRPDFSLDLELVDDTLRQAAPTITFLCSPNNPTGLADDPSAVRHILERAPGLVAVDEAYGQFADWSALDLVADDKPIVVIRTYSKTWSMAAMRLGYLVGPVEVVEALERVALPYHLDAVKQAARPALHRRDGRAGRHHRPRTPAPAVGPRPAARHHLAVTVELHPVAPRRKGRPPGLAGPGRPLRPRARLQLLARLDRMLADHRGYTGRERPFPRRPYRGARPMSRQAARSRHTKETSIDVRLLVEGVGKTDVATGLPFFDHMVSQLGKHAGFDLTVNATGDIAVDAHHTVEDVGILLGETLREALGDRAGVRRFASISVPLDEALIEVSLDLSGRPYLVYEIDPGEALPLGTPPFDPQLAEEFWRAFVTSAAITLHLRMRSGRNTHHILEASFKGVARALRDAVRIDGREIPSTKGVLA